MTRLAFDQGTDANELIPADYFDLMGGVGFGGLAAFMLGYFRMSVDTAINTLLSIASLVFPTEPKENISSDIRMKNLRGALEDTIKECGLPPDQKMVDKDRPAGSCKVALYAATTANVTHPQTFRTYPSRLSKLNPSIVDALCATMATPRFFSPAKIGPPLRQQSFIGGALGANNPTRELLAEAADVFGNDTRVAQIITLGSGRPRMIALGNSTADGELDQTSGRIGADCETVARDLSARLYNINAYLRLNVDRGMENLRFSDWSDVGNIESYTTAYVEATHVTQSIDTSLKALQERIGTATLGQISNSRQISLRIAAKTPPPVTPHFVVRNWASKTMYHHLLESSSLEQRIFVITGMGGCGKTQLVSYFLRENRSSYTRIIYIDAGSTNSIKADLQAWIRSVGDGYEKSVWEDALDLMSRSQDCGHWILILDSADDPALDVVQFIPPDYKGVVIITSRNRNLGNLATLFHLELGQLDREEALSALLLAARRRLPLPSQELEDAYQLLELLGCLPLAVVQAGSYCRQLSSSVEQPFTFTQYLSLFHENRPRLMEKVEPSSLDRYRRGVYATIELSYKAIPETAKGLLHLLSAFNCSSISLVILKTAALQRFADPQYWMPRPEDHANIISELTKLLLYNGQWDELNIQEMIQVLSSFSLLSATSSSETLLLRLHPLIQAWALDTSLYSEAQKRMCRRMAAQIITSCSIQENSRINQSLLPHIVHMLDVSKESLHPNDQMPLAMILRDQGSYERAGYLHHGALHTLEQALGKEHPDTISVMAYLAATYRSQGQWSAAEVLSKKALELRRRILGEDHPDTILSEAQVAWIYSEQGRWIEGQNLESVILEKRTRVLGPDHLDTLWAAANLAISYRALGKWREALALEEEVLKKRTSILGEHHPDTIKAAGNLANAMRALGQWDAAEKLQLMVLDVRKRLLGQEHPDTVTAVANLASTYRRQGRWKQAEPLISEVLERRTRTFGTDHPLTILASSNVADMNRLLGRWSEAERMELGILEKSKRIFGEEHPETATAAADLAATYSKQRRWKEAKELGEKVLEKRKKAFGNEDPDTIWATADLADTYREMGRLEEAEEMELRVLSYRQRTVGREHVDTLWAETNLARTYIALGRYDQAKDLLLSVKGTAKAVASDHPDIAFVLMGLASACQGQGQLEEATAYMSEAVELSIKAIGRRHPETQDRIHKLADLYRTVGNTEGTQQMETLLSIS